MRPGKDGGGPWEGRHPETSPPLASPPSSIAGVQDTAQSSFDDYRSELATAGRDHGLQSAATNEVEWCDRVADWIYDLAPGHEFSADDIRREFGASKASGAVIRGCAQRHVIEHVGWTRSQAVTRHGSDIKVWRRT
jgi:hypothetical protein